MIVITSFNSKPWPELRVNLITLLPVLYALPPNKFLKLLWWAVEALRPVFPVRVNLFVVSILLTLKFSVSAVCVVPKGTSSVDL